MKQPQVSDAAYASDIASLQRILRRIVSDKKRSAEQRRELGDHLIGVIQVLQKEMVEKDESED